MSLCLQAKAANEAKAKEEQRLQAAQDAKDKEQRMLDREKEKRERHDRREKELLVLLKEEQERSKVKAIEVGAIACLCYLDLTIIIIYHGCSITYMRNFMFMSVYIFVTHFGKCAQAAERAAKCQQQESMRRGLEAKVSKDPHAMYCMFQNKKNVQEVCQALIL